MKGWIFQASTVWVVQALDEFVQPVGIFNNADHAMNVAEEFAKTECVNVEVYGYFLHEKNSGSYFSHDRILCPAEKVKLEKARTILRKHFDKDDEDFMYGLEYHVFDVPDTLNATEAKNLQKLGWLFINNFSSMHYEFFKKRKG